MQQHDESAIHDMLQQLPLHDRVTSLAIAILASNDADDAVLAAAGLIRMTLVLAGFLSPHERTWLAIKALEIASELDLKLN